MKIIISHSKTKREIKGAFSLCGSREDLERVAHQIFDKINNDNFIYGFVDIIPNPPLLGNQEPIEWD
jgi:uncharacterized membrane protein affecting hemolysin expression